MKIQEFSSQTGLSTDTIRYYEKIGVLPKPSRGENGYRNYPDSMVEQVRLINRAKDLGFSLNEIKDLSALFRNNQLRRKDMGKLLKKKLTEIDAKISALNHLKNNIQQAVAGLCEFKDRLAD